MPTRNKSSFSMKTYFGRRVGSREPSLPYAVQNLDLMLPSIGKMRNGDASNLMLAAANVERNGQRELRRGGTT
jgi:hypothetical protein